MRAAEIADKSWLCVYPNYIDSLKTIPEGRRISKDVAVTNPSAHEIAEACSALGLKNLVENKAYPRDWLVPGRVRVSLPDDTRNKQDLLLKIAQGVANLKSRQVKQTPAVDTKSSKKGKK